MSDLSASQAAERLMEIADRLTAYTGPMPYSINLNLYVMQPFDDEAARVAVVDALGTALIGYPGEYDNGAAGPRHEAKDTNRGVNFYAYTHVEALDEAAQLRARVAELEAKLAAGAQA